MCCKNKDKSALGQPLVSWLIKQRHLLHIKEKYKCELEDVTCQVSPVLQGLWVLCSSAFMMHKIQIILPEVTMMLLNTETVLLYL